MDLSQQMQQIDSRFKQLVETPTMDIRNIRIKEGRGRKDFNKDRLNELVESIKKSGVMQPIVVTTGKAKPEDTTDSILLVAGERRIRACMQLVMLGHTEFYQIPYRWKKDLNEIEQKRVELEENVVRQDMHWMEKNELLRQIAELEKAEKGTTRGDPEAFKLTKLAEKIDESPGMVSQRISFAEEIKNRPDLAEKVSGLNMSAAMKMFEQAKQSERAQQMVKEGKIQLAAQYLYGDATELIKGLKNDSVDALISDLPFAIPDLDDSSGDSQIYKQLMRQTDNLSVDEMRTILHKLAPEWFRVLKPSSHVWLFFGWDIYEILCTELSLAGFEVERVPIIWDKKSTTASFKGYAGAACYEQILTAHKPPRSKRYKEPFKNILSFNVVAKPLRTHVFEKPIDLLAFMIKQSTNEGDVILDSFAGTGATGIAADQLNRSSILHEIDKDHWFLGQKRRAEYNLRKNG